MPSFEKSPRELIDRFAVLAERIPDGHRRQMFGYPAVTINGHLCFSLHASDAVLRLSAADQADFAATHELRVFEPMPGRPMREYVVLPETLLADDSVEGWIERSASHVRALPPKPNRSRG
jgi:TfoX N-terminal domain